ncbi:MAG TPA: protein-L-isoaspartate O-methyltransferase [Candidatus Paceibacterota bacterium]
MNILADLLTQKGVLKTRAIIEAFSRVDRKDFVPQDFQEYAYGDYPLPIAGEQTISQPTTVAFMLELLQPQQGEKILDVGSGSGWTTALLAFLVGEKGRVFGVERIPELVAFGNENIKKYNFSQATISQADPPTPRLRRARKTLGLVKEAPFDKILVSAAAQSFPEALLSQLKEGGLLVIPVRDAVWRVKKLPQTPPGGEASKTEIQKFEGFAFVPLVE